MNPKLPPQNLEAERALLGGMLIDNDAIPRAIEVLREDDFYREAHREIFKAVLALYAINEPSDLLTITNYLKKEKKLNEVGGAKYLATLIDEVPTSAHASHYAKIIRQKSILRRLIEGATEIVTGGYEEGKSVEEYLDQAETIIFDIASRSITQGFHPVKDVVKSSLARAFRPREISEISRSRLSM